MTVTGIRYFFSFLGGKEMKKFKRKRKANKFTVFKRRQKIKIININPNSKYGVISQT
jgi:hypothetical protein